MNFLTLRQCHHMISYDSQSLTNDPGVGVGTRPEKCITCVAASLQKAGVQSAGCEKSEERAPTWCAQMQTFVLHWL